MSTAVMVVLLVVLTLLGIGAAAAAIVGAVSRSRAVDERPAQFVNAPVGVGQLVDRRWGWSQVGMRRLAHLTFDVEGANGERFRATTELMLPYGVLGLPGFQDYPVGMMLPVRYFPGRPDVVLEDPNSYAAQQALADYNARRGLGY